MSLAATKVIIEQWVQEVWNAGSLSLIDEMHDESYTHHTRIADIKANTDIEYLKKLVVYVRRQVSKDPIQVDDMIAEADRVMVRWSIRGGESSQIAKLITGVVMLTLRNSKITDSWIYCDCGQQTCRFRS